MGMKCEGCGVAAEKKLCPDCRKKENIRLSKECHQKKRDDRKAQGLCVNCGGSKEVPSEEEVLTFVASIEPKMVPYFDMERMRKSTACYKCYTTNKVPHFLKSLPRLEAEANMTPEERKQKAEERKARSSKNNKLRRQRKIAENPNICHHCLIRDRAEGRSWCNECLERVNKRAMKTINERRKEGICIVCGADSGGNQLCDEHKIPQREYSKKWWAKTRQERIDNHICIRCGEVPAEEGRRACTVCAAKAAESNRKAREKRLAKEKAPKRTIIKTQKITPKKKQKPKEAVPQEQDTNSLFLPKEQVILFDDEF
jgi:hypothetical protein